MNVPLSRAWAPRLWKAGRARPRLPRRVPSPLYSVWMEAAALQLGHQPLQAFGGRARHVGRDQVPAVAAAGLEPVLHHVRGPARGADEHVMAGRAGLGLEQLADGHARLLAERHQLVVGALDRVAARNGRRHRAVQRQPRQVAEHAPQHRQADARMHHGLHPGELVLRLRLRAPQHRQDAGHHQHGCRVAARLGPMLLHAAVERDRIGLELLLGVDQVGDAGPQILPGAGGAGLRDDGVALDGACHVQRALHLQQLAVVVQRVQLGRVEVAAPLLVADECVVLPAIPKAEHDIHELFSPAVAAPVLHMRVQAEIERLLLAPGRHHVPGHPALRHVVQRGELAGHVVRLVVGGGRAGDEAEPFGDRGQRPDDRQRLEHVDPRVVGQLVVILRGVAHRDAVGPEHEVDARPLGRAGHVLPQAYIHGGIRLGVRHPPPGRVRAVGDDVEPELHEAGWRGVVHRRKLREGNAAPSKAIYPRPPPANPRPARQRLRSPPPSARCGRTGRHRRRWSRPGIP